MQVSRRSFLAGVASTATVGSAAVDDAAAAAVPASWPAVALPDAETGRKHVLAVADGELVAEPVLDGPCSPPDGCEL